MIPEKLTRNALRKGTPQDPFLVTHAELDAIREIADAGEVQFQLALVRGEDPDSVRERHREEIRNVLPAAYDHCHIKIVDDPAFFSHLFYT